MGGISAPTSTFIAARLQPVGTSHFTVVAGDQVRYWNPFHAGASAGSFSQGGNLFVFCDREFYLQCATLYIGAPNDLATDSIFTLESSSGAVFASVTVPALTSGVFEMDITSPRITNVGVISSLGLKGDLGGTSLQDIRPSSFSMVLA